MLVTQTYARTYAYNIHARVRIDYSCWLDISNKHPQLGVTAWSISSIISISFGRGRHKTFLPGPHSVIPALLIEHDIHESFEHTQALYNVWWCVFLPQEELTECRGILPRSCNHWNRRHAIIWGAYKCLLICFYYTHVITNKIFISKCSLYILCRPGV